VPGGADQYARPELSELVAAMGPTRAIDPRLTGGFQYAPAGSAGRTGATARSGVTPEIRIATARLEKAANDRRSPQSLAALGVAMLVSGRVADAVASLESAVRDDPGHHSAWSDLAAAYLVRSEQGRRPEDLVRALNAADRATRAAPRLQEAWFNRALAIEQIGGLRGEAKKAWDAYLKTDPGSEWSAEARLRLGTNSTTARNTWPQARPDLVRAIEARDQQHIVAIARQFPVRVRDHLFAETLPAWADAVLASRGEDAARHLQRARLMADALDGVTHDSMATDVVAGIERAPAAKTRHLQTLANGIQAFGKARRLADENQINASQPLFEAATSALEQVGSPLSAEAATNRAVGFVRSRRYEEAAPLVDRLVPFAERRRYHMLVGRVRWAKGLIATAHSDLDQSLVEYHEALGALELAGEREDAIRVHNLIAENLRFFGQLHESWIEQRQALLLLDEVADIGGREGILGSAANACIRGELPNAAAVFFDEMVDEAEQSGRPLQMVGAYLRRARSSWRMGSAERAIRDLEVARAGLSRITDASLARTQEIDVLAQEGEVFQKQQPDRAIGALDDAIESLVHSGSYRRLPSLFLARGRARVARGTIDAAEQDFLQGIEMFEEAHDRIGREDLRTSHFDEAWYLFAEMVNLQALQRRPGTALAFAERARARTLREAVETSTASDLVVGVSDERVRSRLAGASVVCYLSLPDRLLAWVLTAAKTDFFELPITQNELERLVEGYQANLARGAADTITESDAMRLYDALLQPLGASLKSSREVIVVPDGPLHGVAFAALKDPRSRRYLVEDHAIGVAPSLALLLNSIERTQAPSPVDTALVVGDPALDRASVGDLPQLVEARAEAKEIASLYSRSSLLTGNDATKDRFMRELNGHDVVHFAGHALQNPEFPWLSRLLLAADSRSSGTLFAYELATQHLDRVRLVVLGACGTAAGPTLRGEGVLNLARPFLAAGVPTVIATLWDVQDRAGRRLLTAFHRNVRAGESAVSALRRAQLDLLNSGDPLLQRPAAWAPFIAIGAPGQMVGGNETRKSLN